MNKTAVKLIKLAVWATLATPFAVLVLFLFRADRVLQALCEYLRPATVEGNYLPPGCVLTNETPPLGLMKIVEDQKNLYQLTLQKVVVCRKAVGRLGFEQRFKGLPFGPDDPCRPLYPGCCSCQFQRHVIVIAAEPSGDGSVLVHANLIQSRWDYLQKALYRVPGGHLFWWLISAIALILALALRSILKE